MRVCPVCESPVAAWECEVCGHLLGRPPEREGPVGPMPDLEVHPSPVPLPAVPPLSELEPTRLAPVPTLQAPRDADWEPGAAQPTPEVRAGGLPDLDSGREPPSAERTPVPAGPITCRYCRNVQAVGMFCDRCGMHLPRALGPEAATVESAAEDPAEELVRCGRCGERTYPGARCGSCGSVLAAPS
ncbi:MAG TPA: hypothetical protein VEJ89_02700 [Myxococcaceae bacterium]|nr:hypothetical protein [Myxococcaceae bacterium]